MKCKSVRELMGAYVYGDLAPHEMKDVRLHTQDCAECREDLRARGLVMDAIPSTVPSLSDEDRQRLMWSVKGAIRAKEREGRSVFWRVAPAFGLAAVLALGLGIGALISSNGAKPHRTTVVGVKPHPPRTPPETARTTPDNAGPTASDTTLPAGSDTPEVAREPASVLRLPLATGGFGGLSGRGETNTRRDHIIAFETPLSIVPDSGGVDGSPEPISPWKLPTPVDVEDADTTPQPPAR